MGVRLLVDRDTVVSDFVVDAGNIASSGDIAAAYDGTRCCSVEDRGDGLETVCIPFHVVSSGDNSEHNANS